MANNRYRKVQPRMWSDEKIRRLTWPPPCGLSLFQYLMYGRETCALPGAMEVPRAGLADRLRWTPEGLDEAFAEVFAEGLAKVDWKAPLIWLPGGPRNNPPESPNVIKAWGKAFRELPECELRNEIHRDVRVFLEDFVKGKKEGYREVLGKVFPDPFANQKQKQKQEDRSRKTETGAGAVVRAPSVAAPPATPPPSPVFETAAGPLEVPPPEVPHPPPISPEPARPMLDRIRKRFGERYARATAKTAHDRSKRSCEAFESLAEFAIDARFTDEQLDEWIGWYFAQPEAKAAEYHATHFRQWMSECAERNPLRAKRGVRKTGMAQVGRPEDFEDDEPDWLKPPTGAHK